MEAVRMRDVAVETFFRAAFENDMYPPENMERVFGVQMDNGVGCVVFNAWKTLYLRGKATQASVKSAIARGRLPEFFEESVRSLSCQPGDEATHSYYTLRLTGEDVDMPGSWSLPAGELFRFIAWERRVLVAMVDAPGTSERAPAAARRPTDAQPRRLFADETDEAAAAAAVGTPIAEGVVLQAEGANGASIPIAQAVQVVEGSPLAPTEERMLRQHLDRFFVGRELVLRHLTIARGQQLNGQRARVVGRDTAPGKYRLHVSVNGDPPFRVLSTNLAEPSSRAARAPAPTSNDPSAVLNCLCALLDRHYPACGDVSMRPDMRARVEWLRSHVAAGRLPPPLRCGDALRAAEGDSWVQTLSHMRPCCYGDNVCDLRRFGLNDEQGLKEWVVTGTCEACQEILFANPQDGMELD